MTPTTNQLAPNSRIKLGIDPTADSLHLGHLVLLRKLRQLQEQGHTAVLVIGDFTATIGDPTGRKQSRPATTQADIDRNSAILVEQAKQFLLRDRLEVHFNSTWLAPMTTEELLKLANQFSVKQLIERRDFQQRQISVAEMLYPLMQGLDSAHLNINVELGGIDQKLNILTGRKLQKLLGQEPQIAMLMPILPGRNGKKMSKSGGNAILLSTPKAELWDQLRSTSDALVPTFFALLTDIEALPADPVERQVLLANEILRQL